MNMSQQCTVEPQVAHDVRGSAELLNLPDEKFWSRTEIKTALEEQTNKHRQTLNQDGAEQETQIEKLTSAAAMLYGVHAKITQQARAAFNWPECFCDKCLKQMARMLDCGVCLGQGDKGHKGHQCRVISKAVTAYVRRDPRKKAAILRIISHRGVTGLQATHDHRREVLTQDTGSRKRTNTDEGQEEEPPRVDGVMQAGRDGNATWLICQTTLLCLNILCILKRIMSRLRLLFPFLDPNMSE